MSIIDEVFYLIELTIQPASVKKIITATGKIAGAGLAGAAAGAAAPVIAQSQVPIIGTIQYPGLSSSMRMAGSIKKNITGGL